MVESFSVRVSESTPQSLATTQVKAGTVVNKKAKGRARKFSQATRNFDRTTGVDFVLGRSSARKIEPYQLSNSSVSGGEQTMSRFGQIVNAIYQHAALPPLDPMAVDAETADHSVALLGYLKYNYNIDMPKFSPREGEDVLFRWDRGRFSYYLTITSDGVNLTGLDPTNRRRCKYEVQGENGLDRNALALALVQATSSSTNIAADDA